MIQKFKFELPSSRTFQMVKSFHRRSLKFYRNYRRFLREGVVENNSNVRFEIRTFFSGNKFFVDFLIYYECEEIAYVRIQIMPYKIYMEIWGGGLS